MADRDSPTVQTRTPASVDERAARGRAATKPVGARLGRYTVVKLLGAGGVGAVYEADDPELGRHVAIKVLHEDRQADTEALRREAQALAKLVHQNVIMVYDVGVADDEVFLVMQLVESVTIDEWLAKHRAGRDEIIAKFRQAGEGLVAAHAAGLVHCDFKPTNVLVDSRGVVRVSDFGLARMARLSSLPVDGPATATGTTTVAGTPAYMAPEQFAGKATAASDQFAFCVALWECLAGERPFENSTASTLDPASRGPRRPLRRGGRMPRYVMRALERGMAENPKDRFPSMAQLLDALEPRTPWVWIAAAAATAGLLVGGAVAYAVLARSGKEWQPPELATRVALTQFGTTACAYSPTIDAGGKRVVFDRTVGDAVDLYEVPLDGGMPRQLTTGPTWEWRAQRGRRPGEVIYLVHDQKEQEKSYIAWLDLDTGTSTPIVSGLIWDATVVGDTVYYSPDAFSGIRSLRGKDDRTILQPATPQDKYFLVSAAPAGDRLAVTKLTPNNGPTQPCIATIATGKLDCLPLTTPARPVFGRDGTALYLATYDGIVRHELATGKTTLVASDVHVDEGGLAIAPDGHSLVFSTCVSHGKLLDVTTGATLIEGDDVVGATASQQENIAWVRDAHGVSLLFVRMPDGREVQLTSAALGSVAMPRFSPDGSRIVFGASEPNPGLRIAYLDRVGQVHQLTDDARDQRPVWTTNGYVAFTRSDAGGNQEAFVIPADGGQPKRLSSSTRAVYGARGNQLLVGGPDAMYWADPVTGAEQPGPPRPDGLLGWAATSPSGNWVVYQMGPDGGDLWRVRVDPPGELEHVETFVAGETVGYPAIRDDGHVLAPVGRWYGDLVRLTARRGSPF